MNALIKLILFLVVFWNLENFFEEKPCFNRKCDAIAKTICMIADKKGKMPDIIAFAEVENRRVLQKLVWRTVLKKQGYEIVHYDSPDRRGIDCALLYNRNTVSLNESRPCHICDSEGKVLPTRDILLVRTDSVAILVNHHPSKIGAGSEHRRKLAMDHMLQLCDTLEMSGERVLSIGDFNDTLWGDGNAGTIKYNGRWQKIDGCFSRGLVISEEVFDSDFLSMPDSKFGGKKPKRSFSGPRYIGGVSDHYPIIVEFTY